MDGFGRHYAKWNKSDRDRQILYITFVWNLNIKTSEYNKKETDLLERTNQWLPVGEERGEGQDRSRGLRDTNYYV